tara:strand:- start:2588 stop:3472 length:885 start_codon:yes stop_codon:yes gene_type:complete
MDVSIIIVNYKTPNLLLNCIKSIFSETVAINFEIIVVDNNSNDGSRALINNNYPAVNYIQSNSNLGFGKANNLGIKSANGRNIFFLNSDTILISNAVKILSDFLDGNENVGVCGGNLFDMNKNPTHSYLKVFPGFFSELNQVLFSVYTNFFLKNSFFNHGEKPIKVSYITGANMMVKRSIINSIGGFDPDFFLYFEETELQFRIYNSGFKIMNLPNSKIIHLEGASSTFHEKKIQLYLQSYKLYLKKIYKFNFLKHLTIFLFKVKCYIFLIINIIRNDKQKFEYWKVNLKIINQ